MFLSAEKAALFLGKTAVFPFFFPLRESQQAAGDTQKVFVHRTRCAWGSKGPSSARSGWATHGFLLLGPTA